MLTPTLNPSRQQTLFKPGIQSVKRFATGPQMSCWSEYGLNNDKDNNELKGTPREKLVFNS